MSLFFEKFGVNLISLVWFVVLFGIVLWLLRRYLFGRVLGAIEKRQGEINDSLNQAERAARSVGESQQRAEALVQEASDHAQEIVRRAERGGAEIEEQARHEAKLQADIFLARARQDIDRERAAALAEIRAQVVDIALAAASRVIEANLDDARNRTLVEESIRQADLTGGAPGLHA